MAQVFFINPDGTYHTEELDYSDYSAESVYIVVDTIRKRIYIWKGLSAPVRLKFISAKVAQEIRQKDYGMAYKVESLEQGDEGREFTTFIGGSTATDDGAQAAAPSGPVASARPSQPATSARPATRPAASARPRASQQPSPRPVSTPQPSPRPVSTPQPSPKPVSARPVSTPSPTPRPQPTITRPTPTVTTSKPAPAVKSDDELGDDVIKSTIEILKGLEEPEGMSREIVIIGSRVFSATKEFHKLFKKEVLRLDPMDDLPDGDFPASDYYTRLFISNGHVEFIELFAEIPRSEREEFLSDMRTSLRDLTKLGI
ncbi:MAG: hypothetical protein ACXAC7_05200 [Candidatus Hodarchaeales archaeon]